MPKLTAIELEKFQTISEHTVIPVRDLTLMFGPNGAGKSSIFDALELMELLFGDDWGKENSKLSNYLDRWARKDNSKKSGFEIGFGLQIHFENDWVPDNLPENKESALGNIHVASIAFGEYLEDFDGKNFRFYIKFKKNTISWGWVISELIIENEIGKILEISTKDEENPRLDIYEVEWVNFRPIDALKGKLKNIEHQNNCFSYYLSPQIDSINPTHWFHTEETGHYLYLDDQMVVSHLKSVSQQVVDFFKVIFNFYIFNSTHKNLPLVKASRTVPNRHELTSVVSGEPYTNSEGDVFSGIKVDDSLTLQSLESSLNKLQPHWAYLSASLAASSTEEKTVSTRESWDELDTIGKVNWMLRDDLFIDNGYQLSGEVLCLVGIGDIIESYTGNPKWYPKIVRLSLTDQHQRKVEIEDVGSGIGYILPVLAALAHDGKALIQQPELHLHPALQSALGESIVRSVENYKFHDQFCLIETHSEHTLLRILKLLKNSNKRADEVLIPLTYERVSILYFEPKADGATKVRRLRVSPDGKLIDRWPGGFFNERFKDLFDDE